MRNLRQRDAEDQQDHEQVQNSLHNPGRNLTGKRYAFFFGDQVGAHRLAGPAEKHHGGESNAVAVKIRQTLASFTRGRSMTSQRRRGPRKWPSPRQEQGSARSIPLAEGGHEVVPGETGIAPAYHGIDRCAHRRQDRESNAKVFFRQAVSAVSLSQAGDSAGPAASAVDRM